MHVSHVDQGSAMDAHESAGVELLFQLLDCIVHRVILGPCGREGEFVGGKEVRYMFELDKLDALANFGGNSIRIGGGPYRAGCRSQLLDQFGKRTKF